jgi:hypothetical protein
MKLVGFIKEYNCIEEATALNELISSISETSENMEDVIKYLNSGALLLGWMGYFYDVTTKKAIAPDAYYTDGIWVWPSYFPYYLAAYPSMKIDKEFLTYLKNKNFEFKLDDNFESREEQLEYELSRRL